MTALAEFMLTAGVNGLLDLVAVSRDTVRGIALRFSIATPGEMHGLSDALAHQVSDVADEIEIFRAPERLYIVTRVWLSR